MLDIASKWYLLRFDSKVHSSNYYIVSPFESPFESLNNNGKKKNPGNSMKFLFNDKCLFIKAIIYGVLIMSQALCPFYR